MARNAKVSVASGMAAVSTSQTALQPTSAVSYSCWINYDGSKGGLFGGCVTTRDASLIGFYLGTDGSNPNKALVSVSGLSTTSATSTASVGANIWRHLAATYDGAHLILYLDNVSASVASTGTISYGAGGLTTVFADNVISNNPFSGSIADAAIWNTGLTSANITSLFNGVRPINVNSANLAGWWPIDGYASPETDLSTNANNLTLSGTLNQAVGPPPVWRVFGS